MLNSIKQDKKSEELNMKFLESSSVKWLHNNS